MSGQTPALPSTTATTTSWAPTAKVSAGMLAGSISVLILIFVKPSLLVQSPEVGAAMTTIITFIVQYMVPERQ
jgi:hypothetical protein